MTDRAIGTVDQVDTLRFDEQGLIPVVVQDERTGSVLMVAWADREALEKTLETGQMHFRSRSRGELWRKGETSGNVLHVRSLHGDCDGDTILAIVSPAGPACHTGTKTCFGPGAEGAWEGTLPDLWRTIEERAAELPDGSYTTRLLTSDNLRLKKLGEELVELVAAIGSGEAEEIREEAADLLYHLLVAAKGAGLSLAEVLETLEKRKG